MRRAGRIAGQAGPMVPSSPRMMVTMKILSGCLLVLLPMLAQAVNWEASITHSDTPLLDSEIQQALGQGIGQGFATAFPGRQYGIQVLLDTQPLPAANGDLVYLALGLCHRLQNGALEIPVGRFSDLLLLPQGMAPEARKEAVVQKLTAVAASFARAMIQNKPAFDHALSSRPQVSGHWSEWPDYRPANPSGTVGGAAR